MSGYKGSRPIERGHFSTPIREIVNVRGDVLWRECSSCNRRVGSTDRECLCGVALLGREAKLQPRRAL